MNLKLYKEYYIEVNGNINYNGLLEKVNKDIITLIEVEIYSYCKEDYINKINIPLNEIMELWEVDTNKRIF